ncbi:Octanoyltransferase LipM [Gimesia algae]|uniref:Octanoyltransferase LipM n=2 Tax=Gimesia algae TaxID=2527971 RepID=A0A517VCC7_9PLAN|nr:Octanoyltransferase LipM [Gimesia algae]
MAIDEALLESAANQEWCTLRWYQWNQPTISLGYFQKNEAKESVENWKDLPRVRRLSGGGAILHHHELTYAFALPGCHPLAKSPPELYVAIHQPIIDVLAAHGLQVQFRGVSFRSETEPFLCFGRGDERDLVYQGQKILGSAQRRRRGAIVQHGSLLLLTSEHATDFSGLLNLTEQVERYQTEFLAALTEDFSHAISQALKLPLKSQFLTDEEQAQSESLEKEKYSVEAWTARK